MSKYKDVDIKQVGNRLILKIKPISKKLREIDEKAFAGLFDDVAYNLKDFFGNPSLREIAYHNIKSIYRKLKVKLSTSKKKILLFLNSRNGVILLRTIEGVLLLIVTFLAASNKFEKIQKIERHVRENLVSGSKVKALPVIEITENDVSTLNKWKELAENREKMKQAHKKLARIRRIAGKLKEVENYKEGNKLLNEVKLLQVGLKRAKNANEISNIKFKIKRLEEQIKSLNGPSGTPIIRKLS